MSETTPAPQGQPAPTPSFPKEVEEGRTFAILCYALGLVGLPFFLVPLIMRNNEFSLYHSKQCLILALLAIAVGVLGSILVPVFCLGLVLWLAGSISLLVLDIIGLVNAVKGEQKPLPIIGAYAIDWFKSIAKV
jgi:uncharacterized membrane protein